MRAFAPFASIAFLAAACSALPQDTERATHVVLADTLWTMAGAPLRDAAVVVAGSKIRYVGPRAGVELPDGVPVLRAKVVTPGLIDARATVGLSGLYNVPHDQDQVERSAPMQPELRAVDAFNARDELVDWLRGFGITTVHTGHGPGALISGQTFVVKTRGRSADQDQLRGLTMIAATLGDGARAQGKGPGTRAKAVALLREELLKARGYVAKRAKTEGDPTAVDLRLEALGKVLAGEAPLLVTVHRAHDIQSALRVAAEFGIKIVLDGAAESYLLLDEIKAANVPVLPHPPMARASGELANATMELPKLLADAGIPFALQSGYEGYVPKTRVVLFEAGIAVRYGLPFERALAAITIDAARLLGVDARVGSIEVGKDADLACFDGDPFEYVTRCTAVVLDGEVVSTTPR